MNARKVEDENYIFRTFLKGQDSQELDMIVNELDKELFDKIDCKTCSNCCKVISPALYDDDIQRISSYLGISDEEFKREYLKESQGNLVFKSNPCRFFSEEGCTIYEKRPLVCREYPFTHQEDIVFSLYNLIGNCKICPVVYEILEKLKVIYKEDFEEYKAQMSDLWNIEPPAAILKSSKIGRNSPCPCGSGKKYKKCYGKVG